MTQAYEVRPSYSKVTKRTRFHVWSRNGVHMKAFDTETAAQAYISQRLNGGKI